MLLPNLFMILCWKYALKAIKRRTNTFYIGINSVYHKQMFQIHDRRENQFSFVIEDLIETYYDYNFIENLQEKIWYKNHSL